MNAPFYLFIHKDFPVDTDGVNSGAETATLWLARTLAASGKRVVMAAQLKQPECTKWGVEFWDLGASYDVPKIIERAHALGEYRLFAACRAWPLVLGCGDTHCVSTHLMAHDPSAGALGISPKLLSHYADSVFCVSRAQSELFIKEGCPADLISVLPNGADRTVFAPAPFVARDLNRIVFAGALVTDKGIDLLIRAFAKVRSTNPKVTLDIYGSSGMWGREPLFDQQQVQKNLPGLVFHGAVSQAEVAKAFQTCAFAASPSRWFDSFPLSAVEAESTGCPVVAFNVGGMSEAIANGESGVIIPEVSEDLLAQCFSNLLGNRAELERLSKGAEALVTQQFTWTSVAQRLIAAVEKNPDTQKTSEKSGHICLISTWNQQCGLATYAKYLWGQLPAGELQVLTEVGVATTAHDESFVTRCWDRKDLSGIGRALASSNPAVIHINLHSVDFLPTDQLAQQLVGAKTRGIPIVAHIHSTFTARDSFKPLREAVDLFIVHDQQNRLELIAQGAKNVVVIAHGIDVKPEAGSAVVAKTRTAFGLQANEKMLVTFGFIQPHKGIESMLEAVAYLRSRGVPARGVVIGQVNQSDPNAQTYRTTLTEFATKLGVSSFINFTDRFVATDEVTNALQAADLVVMNYHSQHFEASGACSIALGAGARIISSLAPMFNSFGGATWRATAGFPVPLAAEFLLNSAEARAALSEQAQVICSRNSWPSILGQLKTAYREQLSVVIKPFVPPQNNVSTGTLFAKPRSTEVPLLVRSEGQSAQRGKQLPLKVLIQNRPNTFTQRGGDTVVIERTVAGLRALGVDCTVDVEGTHDPKLFDIVHIFNFALPELTRIFAERASRAGVPFVVTTLNEDVATFHNQSLAMAGALVSYVHSGQNPSVWVNACQNFGTNMNRIDPSPSFNNEWTANHAAALLTNGTRESETIRRQYPSAKKVVEVPLGFEVNAKGDAAAFTARYGVRDFVLCVGRLESRKNQLMLLKALENEDVVVVLASGGFTYQPEYADAVRRFRRKGQTLVLDKLDAETLASAYRAAKVHALPSWYELPGLVSLEAGAIGCNLVVSDHGTARDYLGDLAFYGNPADEVGIRDAVMTALKRPRPSDLEQHLIQYRWDRTARETKQVYEDVLGISRASHAVQETQEEGSNMTTPQQMTAWNSSTVGSSAPIGGYDMSSESTEFLTLVERGELEAKNMRLESAHALLEQAEMINPSSVRLMKARGTVFLAENKNEVAGHYFERAHRSDPKDTRVIVGLGMIEMRRNQIDKAHEMFVNALRISPDSDVALLQLVVTSYASGSFHDLERCLRQYLHLKPEDIEMQYCLAGCLLKTGAFAESESIAKGILKRKPEHKNAQELIEIIHERHPQITEAIAVETPVASVSAMTAVSSQARPLDADTTLGNLEENKRRKEYDELRVGVTALLERTDLVSDQRELALCLSAECMVMDDKLSEAEATFQEVLALNPNSPRGLCGKAVLKAHLGSWMDAQNLFERARSLQGDYDLALAGLGVCALQANDQETAWARFCAAIKSNPENTRALLGLVQLAYPMKRFTELEAAIRSYLEIHSADLEWVYSLAGVCFAQGKLAEAKEAVEHIQLFKPQDERAGELAQMIEQRQ